MVVPAGYEAGFVCTLKTCSVAKWGFIHYQPSVPGNILFLVIFDVIALAQLVMGIYYKTGGVCVAMLLGLACESLGYIARILMHWDPFNRTYFLWELICLTIGPAFMAAAIYLCLGRIVVIYGEEISRIKPRSYMLFFVGCDVFSLVVQSVGGGIAASFPLTNQAMINLGTHVLVAGLSIQVASLFFFSACSIEFFFRVQNYKGERSTEHADLYNSRKFKPFLVALGTATCLLFVRTVFRSVELSGGFSGRLANSQVQFMILDGTMVILACTCMTVLHPGVGFGNKWADAKFRFTKRDEGAEAAAAVEQGPWKFERHRGLHKAPGAKVESVNKVLESAGSGSGEKVDESLGSVEVQEKFSEVK